MFRAATASITSPLKKNSRRAASSPSRPVRSAWYSPSTRAKARSAPWPPGAGEKELFLVTREQDAFWLTVLDTAEMRPSQKFPVLPAGEELSFWQQWVYPDFVALQVSDGGLALLHRGENGVFETAFTCGGGEQWTERVRYDSIFAYDGARLAVATPMDRSLCSFYLSVYEKNGLAYAGQYQNSLDLSPTTDYAYRCRLVGRTRWSWAFCPPDRPLLQLHSGESIDPAQM